MSDLTTVTHSGDETVALGARIGRLLRAGDVVVLAGDLGAGKTTFAKGVAVALDVGEPVVSPTFTLVRRYDGRLPLVHVDVYRLDRVQEVLDLGLEELADDHAVMLVEWGDVVTAALPREHLEVRLEMSLASDDDRAVTLAPQGPSWWARHDVLTAAASGA